MKKHHKERTILHADVNSCYVSIEQARNPFLRNKPVVVSGSEENRNGIVLAKSQEAKALGIQTGEVLWQARQKCPNLIEVPAHFELYWRYSKAAQAIYKEYTDQVEAFGIDECWLDVSGSKRLFGSGEEIATTLRKRFKKELGISLSIGISFNKIFAKLASDLKKPDAQTKISKENFQEIVWPLPCDFMLYLGPRTKKKLKKYNIHCLGDLAQSDPIFIQKLLGKNGNFLWKASNGLDQTPVVPFDYRPPVKSMGHGSTFRKDLITKEEVRLALLALTRDLSRRLIEKNYKACALTLWIRDKNLQYYRFSSHLTYPSHNSLSLSEIAYQSLLSSWSWQTPIRSITIQAHNLIASDSIQLHFFTDFQKHRKREKIEETLFFFDQYFGKNMVNYASIQNFQEADLLSNKSVLPLPIFSTIRKEGYSSSP